jgi:hypothetical protein
MALFKCFEEGMTEVHDYAILIDANPCGNDALELVFYGLHNDSEFYMTQDKKYSEAHNAHIINSLSNANNGLHTFAEIVITHDDNWIDKLCTEEEIKTKISEEEYNRLMSTFKRSLENNLKCLEKYRNIKTEINKLKTLRADGEWGKLVQQIGDWKQEVYLVGSDIDKYVDIMEKDAKKYECQIPFDRFTPLL